MISSLDALNVESARQAVHSIRGYEYQILAATLAWLDLDENSCIYLEVAEDYATVINDSVEAVQVKSTRNSGSITLNTPAVREAIESFVRLTESNPEREIHLRFLTTSSIGLEKISDDRPSDIPGIKYWQLVSSGREDVSPLKTLMERKFSKSVRTFCAARNDLELRTDLIQRIRWDCDRPETSNLRRELEERVCSFLRNEFEVPHQEALKVVDVLVCRVLRISALSKVQERILTRKDLIQIASSATRVWMSFRDNQLLQRAAYAGSLSIGSSQAKISTQHLNRPAWILDAASIPVPSVSVGREHLEEMVNSALKATGLCFVVGSTGTGKSMLARRIAASFPDARVWIDLRDIESLEARDRLKQVFDFLGEMGSATLMLEDLNCLASPSVQLALGTVVESARRRDMRVIVTSYRRPTSTLLNKLTANSESVVLTPHFDQKETNTLVGTMGGDPTVWGRVAYIAGGGGHPQLTHGFVAGIALRGWPRREIEEILKRGFTNDELEDELSAARTILIDSLPRPTRELLYRLSVTIAPFGRSLATAVGTISPGITHIGERVDELSDRWLEPVTRDRYRISPLVRGLASKMLTEDQIRLVHKTIATETASANRLDAGAVDTILLHGLAGESNQSLAKISWAINSADDETRLAISKHSVILASLTTARPIYPNDLSISVFIRLAQLRLVMATQERDRVNDIVHALLSEADSVSEDQGRRDLEGAILGSILNNLGVASVVDDWVALLCRFREFEKNWDESEKARISEKPTTAVLFNVGVAGMNSVDKLEALFNDLATLDDSERIEFLTPIDDSFQYFNLLVHHPLTTESRRSGFSATNAVETYKRLCSLSDAWDVPALTVQCHIAVAVILEEHLDDVPGAMIVLNEANTIFDDEPALTRAFAKLHHRSGQRKDALVYFRDYMNRISHLGPIDAVYTTREAAICAMETGDYVTARDWFLRAQAISAPLDAVDLGTIGVGLGADAGVACFESGHLQEAVMLLKDALSSIAMVDPNSNLQAAHCHRMIRHAILWLRAKVLGLNTLVAGEPISMVAGACSNPEPIPEIEQHPLGEIDFAWYMLAEIEINSDFNVGVQSSVERLGSRGHLPISEHAFRCQVLGVAISTLNPIEFTVQLQRYLSSATYVSLNLGDLKATFDTVAPKKSGHPRSNPRRSIRTSQQTLGTTCNSRVRYSITI